MDFGIFMEFEIRRGGDQASAFREGFDIVDAAEAWGLDGVWLGEMHFTPARSVLSAPIVVASSIATRTRRLRVGMAVQVLPLNNPLRIAEEAATVAPRPYQLPHPPLRMAATTEETFPKVGEMGLPIFVGLRGMDVSALRHHVLAYRRAWRDAGHPGHGNVYLRIPVYAAATEEAALEEPFDSITFYFSRQADLQQAAVGRTGAGPADRLQARVERLAGLSYKQILAERVAFGSAAGLIDRLSRLREELTLDGIVAELDAGGLIPAERVKKSLAILTREVMPALK